MQGEIQGEAAPGDEGNVDRATAHQTSSIKSLAVIVMREWRLVMLVSLATWLLSAIVLHFIPPKYDAEMVVAPASDNSLAAGLGASLGQLSGLASFAGIRLPDSETVTPFAKFVELTQSNVLAERIEQKQGFLKYFFPSKWDWQAHKWKEPSGPIYAIRSLVYGILDKPIALHPTTADLAKILQDKVSVDTVTRSGMRRISFSYKERWLALALLNAIYAEADNILKEDAQRRVARQIAFLRDRLTVVTITEERTALGNLLLQQEHQAMLAQSGLAYSAHVVEPAFVSEQPTSPKPLQFLLLALVLSLLTGALAPLARAAFFDAREPFGVQTVLRSSRTALRMRA